MSDTKTRRIDPYTPGPFVDSHDAVQSCLNALRENAQFGVHTYSECSTEGCGNRARAGICSLCVTRRLAKIVGDELADRIGAAIVVYGRARGEIDELLEAKDQDDD